MEARIDMLEQEISAMKSEIAECKAACWTREDADRFDRRLAQVEIDIAVLKGDVSQLRASVDALKSQVSGMNQGLLDVPIRLAEMNERLEQFSTKAEHAQLRAELKAWMLGTAISLLTISTGIQFALYTAFKP